MPRPLEEAKKGENVLYFTHSSPVEGEVHRFTNTQIVVRVNSTWTESGYSERKFYKKNGREVGVRWNRIELPTPEEWWNYQKQLKHLRLVKKVKATNWEKLTLATLEGIQRITIHPESKIK